MESSAGDLGRKGEWIALFYFLLRGYRIRNRNWRGGGGEVDLILSRGRNIIFVEVKTRSSDDFGGALASVDARKQAILIRAASAYLSRHELWEKAARFDVLALEKSGRGILGFNIRHVEDAFEADPAIMAG